MVPFFIIWTGQIFSLFGSALVQFALVWWLTKTTGSATVLALATMMAMVPRILISPLAGPLIDRWNRRTVMIIADGLIALAVVALAILYMLDAVQIWHVYLLMFIRSVGGAFHWPAMQASTTLMVPKKHLARIAGMNQTVYGLTNIISPPLGALLFELLPMQNILGIDIVTAVIAITPLFFIPIPQPTTTAKTAADQPSVLADLRQGLRFVRGWPALVIILAIAALANLLSIPALALAPLLVKNHFGGGAQELGWLQAAFGIGIVAGGITLTVWGGFKRRTITVYSAQVLGGLGMVALGSIPGNAIRLAVGSAFFIGFMLSMNNGALQAVYQVIVPPELQGRVFTLVMSASGAAVPLGLAIAGPVGDILGVPIWFVIAGIITIIMGGSALSIPAVMRIEDKANGST